MILNKSYSGKDRKKALEKFQIDAKALSESRYSPIHQSWTTHRRQKVSFVFPLLLCFIYGIGLPFLLYMLLVPLQSGVLHVTYQKQEKEEEKTTTTNQEEKTCPKCAEQIKMAAKSCRFCNFSFESA